MRLFESAARLFSRAECAFLQSIEDALLDNGTGGRPVAILDYAKDAKVKLQEARAKTGELLRLLEEHAIQHMILVEEVCKTNWETVADQLTGNSDLVDSAMWKLVTETAVEHGIQKYWMTAERKLQTLSDGNDALERLVSKHVLLFTEKTLHNTTTCSKELRQIFLRQAKRFAWLKQFFVAIRCFELELRLRAQGRIFRS